MPECPKRNNSVCQLPCSESRTFKSKPPAELVVLIFMVEMKPVKALLHAPQGALHTAQPCFIFCGIAAKCFINPPLRRLCRKVYGLLRTFTDKGMKICLYLAVAKHNGYFSAYFVKIRFFQGEERRL
ncbi:MAG: hypothetical protein IKC65_07025 [Lentisphaeria bacterium]|nr:hypothetical protein [Lentisphaeria bacterium]